MHKRLTTLLGLVSFAIALLVLRHELRATSVGEIVDRLRSIPGDRILLAFALTALDFLPLIGLDWLALKTIGRALPFRRLAATSFIGYAFSRAIGFALLSGGAVRYRLLAAWGMKPLDVAKLIALAAMISWLGFLFVGGIVLLVAPPFVPSTVALPAGSPRVLGLLFLLTLAFYLVWCARRVSALKIGSWRVNLPTIERALAQVAVASADWLLAASVPYVLLGSIQMPFGHFIGVFMLAQVAGVASSIPGGLGVFETVMLLLLGPAADPAATIGALAIYRLIYYLTPLSVAALLLGAIELRLGTPRPGSGVEPRARGPPPPPRGAFSPRPVPTKEFFGSCRISRTRQEAAPKGADALSSSSASSFSQPSSPSWSWW